VDASLTEQPTSQPTVPDHLADVASHVLAEVDRIRPDLQELVRIPAISALPDHADDKGGIITHVAASRSWLATRGSLPVNVRVLIEGEEELGSPHLPVLLQRWGRQLDSDVIVLADLVNRDVGWPSLTYALRGVVELTVRVRTLERSVHSGLWGGAVPDAMTAAYGREPAAMRCGGSIPFVGPLSEAFDGATCLLVGVEDPRSNAHGEDESVHLGDLLRACLAPALLLAELADRGRRSGAEPASDRLPTRGEHRAARTTVATGQGSA